MNRRMTKKAFTLIEILVSVAIIGVLSILIVQAFFTSLRNNTKTELMKDLKQNGDYAMQTMVRLIQNANTISNCSSHSLTLLSFDGQTSSFYSYSDPVEGVCRIASESGALFPSATIYTLTSSNISMQGASCTQALTFTCQDVAGKVAKVDITFGLVQKGSPPNAIDKASQGFKSSVVVRNRQ